mmetsp:Transcript_42727/g.112709  ORF Transcript_42727/g.112709 Transcript_42727/m.112709 type:complete len:241 (-) Transcript_42727:829-1551(-)
MARCLRQFTTRCLRRRRKIGSGRRILGRTWLSCAGTYTRHATRRTRRELHCARRSTWPCMNISNQPATCCTWVTSWSTSTRRRLARRSCTTEFWHRWVSAHSVSARSRRRTIASCRCVCTTRRESCSHKGFPSTKRWIGLPSRSERSVFGSCRTTCTSTLRSWRVHTTSRPCCWRFRTRPCSPSYQAMVGQSLESCGARLNSMTSSLSQDLPRTRRSLSLLLPSRCSEATGPAPARFLRS